MIRLFRVFIPTSVLALLISEVILIYFCFVIVVAAVTEVDPEFVLLFDGGLSRISVAVASIMVALYFQDLYNELRIRSRIYLWQHYFIDTYIGSLIGTISAMLIYAYFYREKMTNRRWLDKPLHRLLG